MPDWIKTNKVTLVIWVLTIAFLFGGGWATLETKVDALEVRDIVEMEIPKYALPIVDGAVMATKIENIEHLVQVVIRKSDDIDKHLVKLRADMSTLKALYNNDNSKNNYME